MAAVLVTAGKLAYTWWGMMKLYMMAYHAVRLNITLHAHSLFYLTLVQLQLYRHHTLMFML